MLIASEIAYVHPDREILFENINFSVRKNEKAALIGDNGTGKSTLLRILAGLLRPARGSVTCASKPYYVPQHFGQYDGLTVAGALGVEKELAVLKEIARGNVSDQNLSEAGEDWDLEEKVRGAMSRWGLPDFPLERKMGELSGGEKTKVFLAGILIHRPEIILLDEPTNHLDTAGREILYKMVSSGNDTLVAVSHDRALLRLLPSIYELDRRGITLYGGNYDFYAEQKEAEENALEREVNNRERELKKAKKTEHEAMERKQRRDARGKKKQLKAGIPGTLMKKMKNRAEKSTARLSGTHGKKIENLSDGLKRAQENLPDLKTMKMDFGDSALHTGKTVVKAEDINFTFGGRRLWKEGLSFSIWSGERISVTGNNGSGKTTLLKMILGELQPSVGKIARAPVRSIYIDQDYSLIKNPLTVYDQACAFNDGGLAEHEIKIRLNRFLFDESFWKRPCGELSGGEKMRLTLCCLMIGEKAPDLFVLDEPTNNLDIRNSEMLASAIGNYEGTLLVVSHDRVFLERMNVGRIIEVG